MLSDCLWNAVHFEYHAAWLYPGCPVFGGSLAGTGAHSYSAGNATSGSEEAARFRG